MWLFDCSRLVCFEQCVVIVDEIQRHLHEWCYQQFVVIEVILWVDLLKNVSHCTMDIEWMPQAKQRSICCVELWSKVFHSYVGSWQWDVAKHGHRRWSVCKNFESCSKMQAIEIVKKDWRSDLKHVVVETGHIATWRWIVLMLGWSCDTWRWLDSWLEMDTEGDWLTLIVSRSSLSGLE